MSPLIYTSAYNHRITIAGGGDYWLCWTIDTKHGRIRYPNVRRRLTDKAGAIRFAKKWKVEMPKEIL